MQLQIGDLFYYSWESCGIYVFGIAAISHKSKTSYICNDLYAFEGNAISSTEFDIAYVTIHQILHNCRTLKDVQLYYPELFI